MSHQSSHLKQFNLSMISNGDEDMEYDESNNSQQNKGKANSSGSLSQNNPHRDDQYQQRSRIPDRCDSDNSNEDEEQKDTYDDNDRSVNFGRSNQEYYNQGSRSHNKQSSKSKKLSSTSAANSLGYDVYKNIHNQDSKYHSNNPDQLNTSTTSQQDLNSTFDQKIIKPRDKKNRTQPSSYLQEVISKGKDEDEQSVDSQENIDLPSDESEQSNEEEEQESDEDENKDAEGNQKISDENLDSRDSDDDEDDNQIPEPKLEDVIDQLVNESFGDCHEEAYLNQMERNEDNMANNIFVNECFEGFNNISFLNNSSSNLNQSRQGGKMIRNIDSILEQKRDQEYTRNIQSHLKEQITDQLIYPIDTQANVVGDLHETIQKVADYVEVQIEDKLDLLASFESKLKKFVFDYRYDQNHEPRKYQSRGASHMRMKMKFRDPRFDQRKIQYSFSDPESNPFNILANEIEVYVTMETNEPCMKKAYYDELEQYLRVVLRNEATVNSNHLIDYRIYFQCILVTFFKQKFTVRIRIHPKESNIYSSRDFVLNSFFKKNPQEIKVFASFVLYWAQKRKILSIECVDKTAWIVWILSFFQSMNRLPQSENFDLLLATAAEVETACYVKSTRIQSYSLSKEGMSDLQHRDDFSRLPKNQSITPMAAPTPTGHLPTRKNDETANHPIENPELEFDFLKFESEIKLYEQEKFIVTYRQLTMEQAAARKIAFEQKFKSHSSFKPSSMLFNVIPLTRPMESSAFELDSEFGVNYGTLFQKFIFYLKATIISSPLAVSITGQIIRKQYYNHNIPFDPLLICDPIFPDMNLVQHLTNSIDAFNHLMREINLAQSTIIKSKSPKIFLQEIEKPVYSKPIGKTHTSYANPSKASSQKY